MMEFALGLGVGFGLNWALFEYLHRRWKRRVWARTNEALDAAEARLEDRRRAAAAPTGLERRTRARHEREGPNGRRLPK